MSWRLYRPRRIGSEEARILRRVLEVDPREPWSAALLSSIETLTVHEEGGGNLEFDSLEFVPRGAAAGKIIARALGTMVNDAVVELCVWTHADVITRLELEPSGNTRLPIRMPLLQSIRPYPLDVFEEPDTDEP